MTIDYCLLVWFCHFSALCFIHLVSGYSFFKKKNLQIFLMDRVTSYPNRVGLTRKKIRSDHGSTHFQIKLSWVRKFWPVWPCLVLLLLLSLLLFWVEREKGTDKSFTSSFIIIIIILGGKREEDRQTDLLTSRNRLCQSFSFYLGQL